MRKHIIEDIVNSNKLIYLYGKVGYGKTAIIKSIYKNKNIKWYNPLGNDSDISEINNIINSLVSEEGIAVIDDFYKVNNIEKIDIKALEDINDNSKIIFISRAQIPKYFRKLLLFRKIELIDICKIEINYVDVYEYLKEKNEKIDENMLKNIIFESKNWPIAIDAFVSAVKMNDGFFNDSAKILAKEILYDYVDERVFNELSDVHKNFLLRLSLLEECSINICKEVISNDSQKLLDEMCIKGSFISKNKDEIYVLNSFFKGFLEKKSFEFLDKESINNIYDDAIRYYESKKIYYNALGIAIKKDDKSYAISILEKIIKTQNLICNLEGIYNYAQKIGEDKIVNSSIMCAFMILYNCAVKFNKNNIIIWHKNLINSFETSNIAQENKEILLHKINMIVPFSTNKDVINSIKSFDNCDIKYKTYLNLSCNIPSVLRGIRDFSKFNNLKYESIRKSVKDDILKATMDISYAEVMYERNDINNSLRILSKATYVAENSCVPVLYYAAYTLMIRILFAQGKESSYGTIMYNIEQFINNNNALFLAHNYKASKVKFAIINNKNNEINKWLSEETINDTSNVGIFTIYSFTIKARAYIYKNEYMKALFILEKLAVLFKESNRTIDKIENLLLQSIVYYNMDQKSNMNACIEKAIEISIRYGYIRIFADEGMKISIILKGYLKNNDSISQKTQKYIKQIIREANKFEGLRSVRTSNNIENAVEDLTYMEEEVLKLLAKGLKYADIAKGLNIKMSTVKTHIYNIYSKLNVTSKSEAILVANNIYNK